MFLWEKYDKTDRNERDCDGSYGRRREDSPNNETETRPSEKSNNDDTSEKPRERRRRVRDRVRSRASQNASENQKKGSKSSNSNGKFSRLLFFFL